jgi:hypothetical protein
MQFLTRVKAVLDRFFRAKLTVEMDEEIAALDQRVGRQVRQLKSQEAELKRRKDAALGQAASILAHRIAIDELCGRLHLTKLQRDELMDESWALALPRIEKNGSKVLSRYITSKSVRAKRDGNVREVD